MRISTSSAAALAYSTTTSKYRSSARSAGVDQLELRGPAIPPAVLLDQPRVRERRLGILVEHLHVGVRRRGVEVEVVLLDVLAVIALAAGEPEEALLEDRIAPVPQGQREAEPPVVVGDPGDPVLAPAVGARARVVVREEIPGRPVGAVVLAHRAPLALGQVGPPAPPVDVVAFGLPESLLLCGERRRRRLGSCRGPAVVALAAARRASWPA